jgi:hypothetical protein
VELKKHLDTWVGKMPLGFHKFVAMHMLDSNEAIFEKLCKERHFDVNLFNVSKEFTLNYIEKVKMFYNQIDKEEFKVISVNIEHIDKVLNVPNYQSIALKKEKKGHGHGQGQGVPRGKRGKGNRGGRGGRGGRGRGN